jgi:hypothetical protein
MAPGRLLLWVKYMFPQKGYAITRQTARHARSPIMTFLYSTDVWAALGYYYFTNNPQPIENSESTSTLSRQNSVKEVKAPLSVASSEVKASAVSKSIGHELKQNQPKADQTSLVQDKVKVAKPVELSKKEVAKSDKYNMPEIYLIEKWQAESSKCFNNGKSKSACKEIENITYVLNLKGYCSSSSSSNTSAEITWAKCTGYCPTGTSPSGEILWGRCINSK